MTPAPEVILFGGCNGAGKTTLALQLLGEGLNVYEFVNADEIARGLNPLNPAGQSVLASRLAIQRVNALVAANQSFAFESTLAGGWQAKVLKTCQARGYITRLIFVWLPSPAMAKARVHYRVTQGGHDIPEDIIERRYDAGLANLCQVYLPLVDHALVFNGAELNATPQQKLIARKENGHIHVSNPQHWRQICPETI